MFDGRDPIYLQIANGIKDEVLKGALKEGEQVMSTNQYAAFYQINPATAAKGFAQLVDEGVLYKKRGIGMFVSPDARARHPEGLVFSDPLATLSAAERRELERSLVGFLAHLDELWDAGALPQTFTAG